MLWLALRLPLLPLEVFPKPSPPSAVVAAERILVCDFAAAQGGVCAGMRLADAWAMLPALAIHERDSGREARQLAAVACWAGSFTSEICLVPPGALLLELAGSQRLFGGIESLLARIRTGIDAQGHVACMALAPTPQAALWLAGSDPAGGDGPWCTNPAEIRAALEPLPLAALGLPAAAMARLQGFGLHRLGELLRLPRAGLARRIGHDCIAALARALGELPDPRARFVFPETFDEALELPGRIEEASRLLFAARRLLERLCGWLAARSAGVSSCSLWLEHEGRAASELPLAFASATRDGERFGRVLRERLERLPLPAPVVGLRLEATAVEALPGREGGLFGESASGEGVAALIERLQARLGMAGVHGLVAAPEHRPEHASRPAFPGGSTVPLPPGLRPCWLLPEPQPLPELGGRPQRGGPLRLLAGPERIESGWWDAGEEGATGDVRRDYYIALSPRNERLWLYRDVTGWFLHGIFS